MFYFPENLINDQRKETYLQAGNRSKTL